MGSSNVYPGGGGDYTSLQAWEDVEDGSALSTKTARVDDSGDAAGVLLSGWSNTPDASNQVTVINDTAGDLHAGTDASGSSSARITSAFVATHHFTTREPYVTLDGLFIDPVSNKPAVLIEDSNVSLKNCYFSCTYTTNVSSIAGSTGLTDLAIENTIVWQQNGTAVVSHVIDDDLADLDITNCTIVTNGTAATQRGLMVAASNTWTVYSTYVAGFSDNWNENGTFAGDDNAQDDADPQMPGTANNNLAETDQFVDAANGDFNLKSGADLIGLGSTTNSTATDYAGTTRDASPDIGAHEFVAAAAGDSFPAWLRRTNILLRR